MSLFDPVPPAEVKKSQLCTRPALVRGHNGKKKIKPSAYFNITSLSTDQRLLQTKEMRLPKIIQLLDISAFSNIKDTQLAIDEPLFQPFPSELYFQRFVPCQSYELPLSLRNNDKVARAVRVSQVESPYFEIITPPNASAKVAPGIDITFTIKFMPTEQKDYYHEIVVATEREKFLVPVHCMGSRAVLDFPDTVDFGTQPVKHESTKTLLIRNVGSREARFSFKLGDPYSVKPTHGSLGIGGSMQVHISYNPSATGSQIQDMVLQYDTGEDVSIGLCGSATDANVRLEKTMLKLETTYITMSTQKTISIHNRSNIVVHYQWKKYATLGEERNTKDMCFMDLEKEEEDEMQAFINQCIVDPTKRHEMSLITRSYHNKKSAVNDDGMLFSDDIIVLEPMSGEIWPNSSTTITVMFKPEAAKNYTRMAYCDITGRETRLPLKIVGDGLGPKAIFSCDSIDIGNVFIGSRHSYEVILENKGDIPIDFNLIQPESIFGPLFNFYPSEGKIAVGELQLIKIVFSSHILGTFTETFRFAIKGAPDTLALRLHGTVIGPTFHFDTKCIKFGNVSYGFVNSKIITLYNTSDIVMRYRIRIPDDVYGRHVPGDKKGYCGANEFDIAPNEGVLNPGHEQRLQVDFVPTNIGRYDKELVVDVHGVGEAILSVPLTAKCIVPAIELTTRELDFKRTFIHHHYTLNAILKNPDDHPAKYEILDAQGEDHHGVKFSSSCPKSVIQPHSTIEVPITIEATRLDDLHRSIFFKIVGSQKPPLELLVYCVGEGPVLSISSPHIDFGVISVLKKTSLPLVLTNESSIPANFECVLERANPAYKVTPRTGKIEPQQKLQLDVSVLLKDNVRFTDNLAILVQDSSSHSVSLVAVGQGPTIVASPEISSVMDLGPLFSSRPVYYRFQLQNKGKRRQVLYWTVDGIKPTKKHNVKMAKEPPPPQPTFTVNPNKLVIEPNSSEEITIHGFSNSAGAVKQKLLCQALIGKSTSKETVFKVDLFAQFIDPFLSFSEKSLAFTILKGPQDRLDRVEKPLQLINVSTLPLTVKLMLNYPFLLCLDNGDETEETTVYLQSNEALKVRIQFDPSYKEEDWVCRSHTSQLTITYKEHPHIDYVNLMGEVVFPNLKFEEQNIDFGCILNDTEISKYVTVTNTSRLTVNYEWYFNIKKQPKYLPVTNEEVDNGTVGVMDSNMQDDIDSLEEKASMSSGSPSNGGGSDLEEGFISDGEEKKDPEKSVVPIEQVFDILPLHGTIEPGDSQTLQFSFYGHENSDNAVEAVCQVEGGPKYKIQLRGQAALVQYSFDKHFINFGEVHYDQIAVAEIELFNEGRIPLDYCTMSAGDGSKPQPGELTVTPVEMGQVPPFSSRKLIIRYNPGVPAKFDKLFKVQVAHFEPDVIQVVGEGVFPRIKLDLPRYGDQDGFYASFLAEAHQALNMEEPNCAPLSRRSKMSGKVSSKYSESGLNTSFPSEDLLESEAERLMVKKFAEDLIIAPQSLEPVRGKKKKPKAHLADYFLDFGHVVAGNTCSQTLTVTNNGFFPVSFSVDRSVIVGSGFFLGLDRVRQLPPGETLTFSVTFDPKSIDQGVHSAIVPFNIIGGPIFSLRMQAHVTMPDLFVSSDTLDFGDVKCGECCIITIQLFNNNQVPCSWNSRPSSAAKRKKERMIPMYRRKQVAKMEKEAPQEFQLIPSSGHLLPGQRKNVQVKFMPLEETRYIQKIPIRMAQSTRKIILTVLGQGMEPKLDFNMGHVSFDPILPHSLGDEKEVVVSNPCPFAVEMYSLEFDKQYLQEEEILRGTTGYNEQGMLLLPPRPAGEKLPEEIVRAYEPDPVSVPTLDHEESVENHQPEPDVANDSASLGHATPAGQRTEPVPDMAPSTTGPGGRTSAGVTSHMSSTASALGQVEEEADKTTGEGVGDLEITPAAAAIARYLGIDLSPEGKAARYKKGLNVIVTGPPLSGKSFQAKEIATAYNAAIIDLDTVIYDSIVSGTLEAGLKAREFCYNAKLAAAEEDAAAQSAIDGKGGRAAKGGAKAVAPSGPPKAAATAAAPKGAATAIKEGVQAPPTDSPLEMKPEDVTPFPCVLPDDVVVEILTSRLKWSDCQHGIVFDGLNCKWTGNEAQTTQVVLKALGNRPFIYVVDLKITQEEMINKQEAIAAEAAQKAKEKRIAEEKEIEVEYLSEDEYDALTDEDKAIYDTKVMKLQRERIRRDREAQAERLRREQEQAELDKLKEEEEKNTRRKRGGNAPKKEGAAAPPAAAAPAPKDRPTTTKAKTSRPDSGKNGGPGERSESRTSHTGSQAPVGVEKTESSETPTKQRRKSAMGKRTPTGATGGASMCDISKQGGSGDEAQPEDERIEKLIHRYQVYEGANDELRHTLTQWDRINGNVYKKYGDIPEEDPNAAPPVSSGSSKRKFKEKDSRDSVATRQDTKSAVQSAPAPPESPVGSTVSEDLEEDENKDKIGVPLFVIKAGTYDEDVSHQIMAAGLPTVEEILDALGLGPNGPPIPPPATFSVTRLPVKRRDVNPPPQHFVFVAASSDDVNVEKEEKKEPEETEKVATPPLSVETKEPVSVKKGKGGRGTSPKPPKGSKGTKATAPSPISVEERPSSVAESTGSTPKNPLLTSHRWVIPANSDVTLRLRFTSTDLGTFDEMLNFETVGTRQRYTLCCRGVCAFPQISADPKLVFANRRKGKTEDDIIQKKYVQSEDTYEFGPLLCGKNRDRYKEGRYPENMERFNIVNTSPFESEVSFCFQNDANATTYLLDPPNMKLKPGEAQELSVWAYPKTPNEFKDCLVCCIRENPQPVQFAISCIGVRPEVELDKKVLQFDRVLIHRKDTRSLFIRNSTLLPVAWRVNGMENLGDDFSLSSDHGVIDPRQECEVKLHFRAVKVINVKKNIRIEISDVDQIMGLVQNENIQVQVEAYDVALDMSFPKGADGGLDFGSLKVFDEAKQTCTLKNRGRYEIGFKFTFDSTDPVMREAMELFKVDPPSGQLFPNDKPSTVHVIFKSKKECNIKDLPILKCQVIEPHLGNQGGVIANIPVKLSARSVFSKFAIHPLKDVNFGPMIINIKKQRQFYIENHGDFEFRYSIVKVSNKGLIGQKPNNKQRGSTREGESGRTSSQLMLGTRGRGQRSDSLSNVPSTTRRQEIVGGNVRAQFGMFYLYPASGTISSNSQQTVTVECLAENAGRCEEVLAIDVSDRAPSEPPVYYKLSGEVVIPGFVTQDVNTIFEEHLIVANSDVLALSQGPNYKPDKADVGVYMIEENKFVYSYVVVGQKACARFKILNSRMVPCDISCVVRQPQTKQMSKSSSHGSDVFEISPSRTTIQPYSHVYCTVNFTPSAIQNYNAIVEINAEGLHQSIPLKDRNLTFDIQGEGTLPSISIVKPVTSTKKNQPVIQFSRLLLGQSQSKPLVIENTGNIPTRVLVEMHAPDTSFTLYAPDETLDMITEGVVEKPASAYGYFLPGLTPIRRPVTLELLAKESVTFEVVCRSIHISKLNAEIKIIVEDNRFEDSTILVVGEGYEDDITLDNVRGSSKQGTEFVEDNILESVSADIGAVHLNFGDCAINELHQMTFTLTNHSSTDPYRFSWASQPNITFIPNTGHLHPRCSKDIIAEFKAGEPVSFQNQAIPCKVVKITFPQPLAQVADWDDRMKIIRWVSKKPRKSLGSTADEERVASPSKVTKKDSKADKDKKAAEKVEVVEPKPEPVTEEKSQKEKVVETEPEPANTTIDDSARDLPLCASATADFASFSVDCEEIIFSNTLMFQSRVFKFNIYNNGNILLDYHWTLSGKNGTEKVSFENSPNERPQSAAGQRRRDLTESDLDKPPFTIEPMSGNVLVGQQQEFKVTFSPLDCVTSEGWLDCRVSNLAEGRAQPQIMLRGVGLMPFCHFELEQSDYISGNRRKPDLKGPRGSPPGVSLDQATRVIEFVSCGINVLNTRSFNILNPTAETWKFAIINEDGEKSGTQVQCKTLSGLVSHGKKATITFEFTPASLDLVESFWRFTIPTLGLSVPLLVVGQTKEPRVVIDRSQINFKSLLLKKHAVERCHIINNEDTPFAVAFDEKCLTAHSSTAVLQVQPMQAVIPPRSSLPVDIIFEPYAEGLFNYNLIVDVKKKPSPLQLNVKGEGYQMQIACSVQDQKGSQLTLLPGNTNNIVNFGEVQLNEKSLQKVTLINSGKFDCLYDWKLTIPPRFEKIPPIITVTPSSGVIKPGSRTFCDVAFCPPNKLTLRDVTAVCEIKNGRPFPISLIGAGILPDLHFSFKHHDFGPCFLYQPGMSHQKTTLIVTNQDIRDISIDCLYQSNAFLEVTSKPCVIPAGKRTEVTFSFYPRHIMKYSETVTFLVNGLSTVDVVIAGQGTELKVDVVSPKKKIANFGALQVGETCTRTVSLVNRSLAPVSFLLVAAPNAALPSGVLSINPAMEITMKPRNSQLDVQVRFAPTSRVPYFSEEVMLECVGGISVPLFTIQGSCQAVGIELDTEHIPFGAVVRGAQSTRKLVMYNTGDIGARFRWNETSFAPDFSISPVEGYVATGMHVDFIITFHPAQHNRDVRYDNLVCDIEDGTQLYLTLTGACIPATPTKEVLNFVCSVRSKETRSLTLHNKTGTLWTLVPVIEGEYFSGAEQLIVEPGQHRQYEVTYQPLTMTTENRKHNGSIFFPLPDGTGLLYNMTGFSDQPRPIATLPIDIPAKTQHTETLRVHNWLRVPQRFIVIREILKPDRPDPATNLKGFDYIDVPGLSERDYKLHFEAYKEGNVHSKITFKNEQSGEFQFYFVTYKVSTAGVIDTIKLTAPVRQSVSHTIPLYNPLSVSVTLNTQLHNSTEISLLPTFTVPASSEGLFSFEYMPLKAGRSDAKIVFNSVDLGQYIYEVELLATPAGPERALIFKTGLGNSQVLQARLINYSKTKVDYTSKTDNADFHVEKNTQPATSGGVGGTEVTIEVTFEPSQLGDSKGTLIVSSGGGGEYIFPLIGHCHQPKPQGPFTIRAGQSIPVQFKNVFPTPTTFLLSVDNSLFSVKQSELIRAKKTINIMVTYNGSPSGQALPVQTGKLIITNPKSTSGQTIHWVFYLKGVSDKH
ncbi:hypothetical protein ACHWQZ_G011188 [Mnemiopsis leidyi]